MPVIFELKKADGAWASDVNEALRLDWPEYIAANGAVGSQEWWSRYADGRVPSSRITGVVTFVGKRTDEFNEAYDAVEVDSGGELGEYFRVGYWNNPLIHVGATVAVECFEIEVSTKHGPLCFLFESLVKVLDEM